MDYCTLWFEGWWSDCCKAHDDGYLAQVGQAVADSSLFRCVADSAPHLLLEPVSWAVGVVMFAGVSLFGRRFYKRAAGKPVG